MRPIATNLDPSSLSNHSKTRCRNWLKSSFQAHDHVKNAQSFPATRLLPLADAYKVVEDDDGDNIWSEDRVA